jgi:hypothetical protein
MGDLALFSAVRILTRYVFMTAPRSHAGTCLLPQALGKLGEEGYGQTQLSTAALPTRRGRCAAGGATNELS